LSLVVADFSRRALLLAIITIHYRRGKLLARWRAASAATLFSICALFFCFNVEVWFVASHVTTIEIRLQRLQQLFNSLDPAPFHLRDLDDDAEQYIVDWAREVPHDAPLALSLHLPAAEAAVANLHELTTAIRHYFACRAEVTDRQFRLLLADGRLALMIGLSFLVTCIVVHHLIADLAMVGLAWSVVEEGLLIAGWVAMWRPVDIFLYQWWPLRHRRQIYRRLAAMPVSIAVDG
jgi:hypothetical protein